MEKTDKDKPKQGNKLCVEAAESKAREPKRSWLLGFILSLTVAGAYVVGTSFYEGYMQGQGFSYVHFPLTVDERYMMAYYAVVVFLFKTVEPLTNFWQSVIAIDWSNIAVLGMVGLVVHITFRFWTHRAKIEEWFDKRSRRIKQEDRSHKYRVLLTELFLNVGIVYGLMIVSLVPMALVIYISGVFFVPNAIGLTRGVELIGIIDSTSMSSIVYELKSDDKIERSTGPINTHPDEAIK